MTAFLLYLKHRLPVFWKLVEAINTALFQIRFGKALEKQADECLKMQKLDRYHFRRLSSEDASQLNHLLCSQKEGRLTYFKPHAFDKLTLISFARNPAFIMFGAFHRDRIVGYFFLRCFWNRKCFVGRMIDEDHEGKGIGRIMNAVMYNTAWQSGFQCMTTVSKNNELVMRSHSNNPAFKVVKELPNDYLLVEFIPPQQ